MMRRGWRRIASTAAIALGIGSRSSGFSPSGKARGHGGIGGWMGGGTAALVVLRSIGLVFSIQFSVFRKCRVSGVEGTERVTWLNGYIVTCVMRDVGSSWSFQ